MSTMLGRKAAWAERTCGCCEVGPDKRGWKRAEEREWRADLDVELCNASAVATKLPRAAQNPGAGPQ